MKPEDIQLPAKIQVRDLKYPSWESYKDNDENRYTTQFELWYTERFGWCIPTLLINKANRSTTFKDRTYGVSLEGQVVRMGRGPHILKTVMVYVRNGRKAALQKFLDLKIQGEASAGDIRDTISTRRAQGAQRRMGGLGGFAW